MYDPHAHDVGLNIGDFIARHISAKLVPCGAELFLINHINAVKEPS